MKAKLMTALRRMFDKPLRKRGYDYACGVLVREGYAGAVALDRIIDHAHERGIVTGWHMGAENALMQYLSRHPRPRNRKQSRKG